MRSAKKPRGASLTRENEDGGNAAGPTIEVDPGALGRNVGGLDHLSARNLGADDRERPQTLDLVRRPPDDATSLGRDERGPSARTECPEVDSTEDVRASELVDLSGREDDVLGVGDCLDEGVVLGRVALLGELHVVDDHPGSVTIDAVDHERVLASRERPLEVELVEGHIIDPDDDQLR